jgi:uncharacterized protein
MRLSQFSVIIEDYPQKGRHLVYNTLSRALVEVDNVSLSMLYSLGEDETDEATASVLESLQAQGIVVSSSMDEAELYRRKFSEQRARRDRLHATILTTLKCPMRCVYCYQKHIKSSEDMSPEMVRSVTSRLEEHIHRNGVSQCMVTFYGGEPLMNLPAVECMGRRLRGHCDDRSVELRFAMVTSGLLLTPEVAGKLKGLGVGQLQITLDGDRDIHDRRRPQIDGSGTFDIIMRNLSYLIDDFLITIACNVDRSNVEAAYRLMDTLHSQGLAGKLYRLIFGPVSATFEQAQRHHMACPGTDREELISLTLYAASMGFARDLRPRHRICGMLLPNHFIIDVYGAVYTCPSFLGRSEYQVGAIDSLANACVNDLQGFELREECLGCAYVPICAAGCRFNALVEEKDIQAMNCQKELFSQSIPMLIKAHYDMRERNVQSRDFAEDNRIPEGTS